jgi:valyl-tRNA synthetase
VKFFHLQFEAEQGGAAPEPLGGSEQWLLKNRGTLLAQNRWILSRVQTLVETVEKGLVAFEINLCAQALYEFSWHELCDWYIELAKLPLREGGQARLETLYTLQYVLDRLMRTLHPFMPFVTEELWQSLPWTQLAPQPIRKAEGLLDIRTIMLQPFPNRDESFVDSESEKTLGSIQEMVLALRNFRGENNISPKTEFSVQYHSESEAADAFIRKHSPLIQSLARVSGLEKIARGGVAASTGSGRVSNQVGWPRRYRRRV